MPIIKEEPHLGFSCKFYDNGVAKVGTTAAARFSMKVKPDVDFDVQLYIELVKQKAKGRAIEVPEVPPELVAAAAAAADKAASEKAAEAAAREAATRERAAAAAAAKAAEPTLQETVLKAVRAKMQEVQEETKEQLKREIGPLREWLEQQGKRRHDEVPLRCAALRRAAPCGSPRCCCHVLWLAFALWQGGSGDTARPQQPYLVGVAAAA